MSTFCLQNSDFIQGYTIRLVWDAYVINSFITNLSHVLNLEQHEASQYGTFETQNGKLITIRVSNHNARVSFLDKTGEEEGISIAISNPKDKGILNDGDAHLAAYFCSKQALQKAESKPLSDIKKSA